MYATQWRVIDCTESNGSIRIKRGNLVISTENVDSTLIPFSDCDLLFVGPNMSVGASVIQQCARYDVSLLLCDWRGIPVAGLYPWENQHNRIGARQSAQANISEPKRKNAWGRIVKSKIFGQAQTLKRYDASAARFLTELSKHVASGDPQNCEAQAARVYWSSLPNGKGFHRIPGNGDTRNGQYDYAYTILRGRTIRAVLGAGLCTSLGFFHRNHSNFFALADDIIEPFRPAVDSAVLTLTHDQPLDAKTKAMLVKASNRVFDEEGETIPTVMNRFAQQIGRYCEGDIDRLNVPKWKALDDEI
ncbi:type II CRISPR-associated endonuclease Cas1 [Bifidobacterium bombi]|uniref:CRISPR-associated endonuclease Cas1 n=1 Tax=Bifidobacterium bombi DSM 19703 TaxID=1341695 RepID=A0A080N4D7_9BIFI|nr:type II CRISPR-associated endonuclease Cas1 [Bifidobacterium bombi]KFF31260.1 CRISPR-associated protein Cas1 [Bifidobacterium bombi DSM 19703]